MINHHGEWTIDTLVNSLGMSGARDFLETSLPEVVQRNNTLQHSLQSKDYNKAVECAQHTLGSVRFFGSWKLEKLLLKIAGDPIDSSNAADHQRKLSREFESVIRTIRGWLAEDNPNRSATDTVIPYPH